MQSVLMNPAPAISGATGSSLLAVSLKPVVSAVLDLAPAADMATAPGSQEGTVVARPLVLGYACVTADADSNDIDCLRLQVAEFAEREGFALDEVFIDVEASGSSAFAALIDAALARHADAVVVPALHHFGRLSGVRAALQELLERRAGVRVVVMRPCSDSPGCHTGATTTD